MRPVLRLSQDDWRLAISNGFLTVAAGNPNGSGMQPAYLHIHEGSSGMTAGIFFLLVVIFFTFGYLFFALLRPEVF